VEEERMPTDLRPGT